MFHPWIGSEWGQPGNALGGVRLLVVGESHYCSHEHPELVGQCSRRPSSYAAWTYGGGYGGGLSEGGAVNPPAAEECRIGPALAARIKHPSAIGFSWIKERPVVERLLAHAGETAHPRL